MRLSHEPPACCWQETLAPSSQIACSGSGEGKVDGWNVSVGTKLVAMLGPSEGLSEGNKLGTFEGEDVGSFDGNPVGVIVGTADGAELGVDDGSREGSELGPFVIVGV